MLNCGEARRRNSGLMRSWVFRHRLRLRVVYGVGPAAAPPAPPPAPRLRGGARPGTIERRGGVVILRPPARAY